MASGGGGGGQERCGGSSVLVGIAWMRGRGKRGRSVAFSLGFDHMNG
jgi:hypothetical protein